MAKKKYKLETEIFNTKHHKQMQKNLEKLFSSETTNDSQNKNIEKGPLFVLILIIIFLLLIFKISSR